MRASLPPSRASVGLAVAVLSLVSVSIASCGDDDPYDTSCTADSDCVVVPVGQDCGGCGNCRRTTINSGDLERYKEDRKDTDVDCSDQGEVICTGLPCTEPTAFCANDTCSLR